MKRCSWALEDKPDYLCYHDTEWGVPVYEDRHLFEMLVLEGAQAGLSWYTVLKRRSAYRKTFKNFEVTEVAKMENHELEDILVNSEIIKNRLKVFSARQNARVFAEIQAEFGTFSTYLWGFVDGKQIVNAPETMRDVPAHTPLSDHLSKDLKKRGMCFVGSTIIYAYMQAVGLVDDHLTTCFKKQGNAI